MWESCFQAMPRCTMEGSEALFHPSTTLGTTWYNSEAAPACSSPWLSKSWRPGSSASPSSSPDDRSPPNASSHALRNTSWMQTESPNLEFVCCNTQRKRGPRTINLDDINLKNKVEQ